MTSRYYVMSRLLPDLSLYLSILPTRASTPILLPFFSLKLDEVLAYIETEYLHSSRQADRPAGRQGGKEGVLVLVQERGRERAVLQEK